MPIDTLSSPEWKTLLNQEKQKPYFQQILNTIDQQQKQGITIYPKKEDMFNAITQTPFANVKVVILGQDPYHGPNQAHGLSFSVKHGTPPPPSLKNIFKELQSDTGFTLPAHGDLQAWAEQGVLLLNTTLSVQAHQAASHAKIGWQQFTDTVITTLNQHSKGIAYLLWGAHAHSKKNLINTNQHLILTAPHPSPLSAYRGFLGCRHFTKANDWLIKQGRTPINWQLPD
jgi:uracil-DNA glycosylase